MQRDGKGEREREVVVERGREGEFVGAPDGVVREVKGVRLRVVACQWKVVFLCYSERRE